MELFITNPPPFQLQNYRITENSIFIFLKISLFYIQGTPGVSVGHDYTFFRVILVLETFKAFVVITAIFRGNPIVKPKSSPKSKSQIQVPNPSLASNVDCAL